MNSVPPRFREDVLTGTFASDLSELIDRGRPDLWVHGHVHDSCDYRIGDTRILCNPRGYNDENSNFNPVLVINVRVGELAQSLAGVNLVMALVVDPNVNHI